MKTPSSFLGHFCLLTVCAAILLYASPAGATVNAVGYWRLGEDDLGAVAGAPITYYSVANGAIANLNSSNSPTYSADVASNAAVHVDSSLSLNLTNSAFVLATTVISTATDNFGIEAWVKPTGPDGNVQVIAYNGDTGVNGWGIMIDQSTNYTALFGGSAIFSGLPAQPDVWTHVALVRSNGMATLFIDGVATVTSSGTPAVPSGKFGIGTPPQDHTGQLFTGLIDEVRVFTFATNQFSTNDLLLNAGPAARAEAASPLTADTSILHGYVYPHGAHTTARFLWGVTTNYGQTSGPIVFASPTDPAPAIGPVGGLTLGTTYHYAIAVSNSFGTNISGDSVFTVGGFATGATGLPNVYLGAVGWGDYDNDGWLDIFICGVDKAFRHGVSQIWHNNHDGTFSNINAGVTNVGSGSFAWTDYDNDGRLDFLLSGADPLPVPNLTQVWHNNGNGSFTELNIPFPVVVDSSIAWGDFDNDGRPDILLGGFSNSTPVTQIWHNDGDGTFSNIDATLPPLGFCSVAWGDFDNDGYLDILLSGRSTGSTILTQVWRNNGDGTFSNINAGLPGVWQGATALGDYDNDGWLDVALCGRTAGGTNLTQIWRNNGNGTFSNINAGLPGVYLGSLAWGDYDNDGRLDLALAGNNGTGSPSSPNITQIWHNNGDGTFSNINAGLIGVMSSSLAWGDYNNDGRLGLLIIGTTNSGSSFPTITQLWRNQTLQTNVPPQAPSGLSITMSNSKVVFHWSPGSDSQTPAAGLTYNIRVGSTPGASDIIAPLSGANGFMKVAQSGFAQSVGRLSPAKLGPYYWSVQSVDSSFAGSAFAPEQTFMLQATLPNAVPGDVNGDGVLDASELAAVLAHLGTNGTVSRANLDLALRNYFAAYPLVMSNVDGLGGSNILFTLPNSPDPNLSVQSSTDLVNWQMLGPVNYGFIDTNAITNLHQFYRLSYP